MNYHDHAAEGGNKVAGYPTIFFRGPSSLLAHGNTIPIPPISTSLDYEADARRLFAQAYGQAIDMEILFVTTWMGGTRWWPSPSNKAGVFWAAMLRTCSPPPGAWVGVDSA